MKRKWFTGKVTGNDIVSKALRGELQHELVIEAARRSCWSVARTW